MSALTQFVPAGAKLNRLVATLICQQTGGLPDEKYADYSGDVARAFEAVDAFLRENSDVKLTIEYPMPEVWLKRYFEERTSGWVPVAYTEGDTLPHALCLAILKAAGHEEEISVAAAAS